MSVQRQDQDLWIPGQEPAFVVLRRRPSAVPAPTLRAYLSAEYVVHAARRDVVFRVGHASPDVLDVLHDAGAMEAALITAFNPRSQPQARKKNQGAHQRLLMRLDRDGYKALPASGRDPSGHWSAEPSVLILGMGEAEADALGAEFQQNAYVRVAHEQLPRLIVLR